MGVPWAAFHTVMWKHRLLQSCNPAIYQTSDASAGSPATSWQMRKQTNKKDVKKVFTGQAWNWYKHAHLHFLGQNSDPDHTYRQEPGKGSRPFGKQVAFLPQVVLILDMLPLQRLLYRQQATRTTWRGAVEPSRHKAKGPESIKGSGIEELAFTMMECWYVTQFPQLSSQEPEPTSHSPSY